MSQYLLRYEGFARTPGWCHVIVATDGQGKAAALVGELEDNPGTSTINAIESIADSIAKRLLEGRRDFALYQYDPEGLPDLKPTFYVVTWNGQPGAFSMPTWDVVEPTKDPWLRHISDKVRRTEYAFGSLKSDPEIEQVDATEGSEGLRWSM